MESIISVHQIGKHMIKRCKMDVIKYIQSYATGNSTHINNYKGNRMEWNLINHALRKYFSFSLFRSVEMDIMLIYTDEFFIATMYYYRKRLFI